MPLDGALAQSGTAADLTHEPDRGAALAIADLLAEQVTVAINIAASVIHARRAASHSSPAWLRAGCQAI